MTDAQLADVMDHLRRKAGFMDRQAVDIEKMSGTPDEMADNKDRATILRERAVAFREAGQLLLYKNNFTAPSPAAPGRTADHGGAVELNNKDQIHEPR